ncbi:condensation domain-containing protein [Streptomyces sp. CB02460]|uniref:condensation domain-containing protein n=1 Tax=Streptomyces sp. CB02460 TaxID=1703941 RepID=UPI00093E6FCB|nr:condensation domain-containing protein [Streptomyces sp. CB02460]OKJ72880.1 non-ribosomal peptide synthetase condensation domain protein [Streptomyces sp. CB02460]
MNGLATARTLHIPFAGGRAGTAPLTWGQRAIWNAILRTAPNDIYFNIGRLLPLGERGRVTDLPRLATALTELMERHEALRTRLYDGEDGDPRQSLTDCGALPVTVVDEPAPDRTEATARGLLDELSATRFDYAREWPLRVGAVCHRGRVTHAALVLCHLAADGHAAEQVVRDLRLLVRRGSAGRPPRTNPLDLARDQHTPAGVRRSERALARWESFYRTMPPTMFPRQAAPPRTPRFWSGRLVSEALMRATDTLAAAHRISGSTVLMTALAALVAAEGGHPAAAMMPIVANRAAEDRRDLVAMLSQDAPFLLDTAGAERFTDLLPVAWRAALAGYRAASYDPVAWEALRERVGRERGTPVHPYCCYNDQRFFVRPPDEGPPPSAAELRAARARTEFGFPATEDKLGCRYCVHVTEQEGVLAVMLTADTAYLPPPRIRAHLWALEEMVVASACGEAPLLAGLPALLARAEAAA